VYKALFPMTQTSPTFCFVSPARVEASLLTVLQYFIHNSFLASKWSLKFEMNEGENKRNGFKLPFHPGPRSSLQLVLGLVSGRKPSLGQCIYKYYKHFFSWKGISFIYWHPQKAEKHEKRETEKLSHTGSCLNIHVSLNSLSHVKICSASIYKKITCKL